MDKDEKSISFKENNFTLKIEYNSQPYIADFNGDFMEDIMYNHASNKTLMVAFQSYYIQGFITV